MYSYNPEIRKGEIFVGNTRTSVGISPKLLPLRTIRLGNVALDIDGKKLDPDYCRPIFVHETEYARYNAIMQAEVSAIRRR